MRFFEHPDTIYQANTFIGHACYFIQTPIIVKVLSPCVSLVFIINETEGGKKGFMDQALQQTSS